MMDIETIQAHIDKDDDGNGHHDCPTCVGNQVALLAEVKRLRQFMPTTLEDSNFAAGEVAAASKGGDDGGSYT